MGSPVKSCPSVMPTTFLKNLIRMSTIACQFSCRRGFANKGQDVSRASVTSIVRSVHYTGWQLQNGQLSTALGSCVYSRAADPFIQLWFTMLAKAESYLCRRERISCKNLALTSCTPASQKKLSFFTRIGRWRNALSDMVIGGLDI